MTGRHALALAGLLAFLHALAYVAAGPIDDDFICLQYARNLAEGHGFVFHAGGPSVEGFTTPFYTLLMALLAFLGFDLAQHAHTVGILGAVAATVAIGLAWRVRFPAARWCPPAWIVAATPAVAFHANAGLGTTLLAAFLALFVMAWEQAARDDRPPVWAGAWLAIACFTRQECALFVLPFAWIEARAGRVRPTVAASVFLVGWTVFRWATWGRLLPITYDVKKLPVGEDLARGAAYLWEATLLLGFVPLVALAWLAPRRAARHRSAPLVGAAAGLTLHTLYVAWVGGDFVPWARFLVPTFPIAVYLVAVGLRGARPGGFWLTLVAMAALQWPSLVPLSAWEDALGRVHRLADHERSEQHWAAIGAWMRDAAPEGTCVATSPIGALAWHSELEVFDLLGLTHEGALDAEPNLEIDPKGHQRTATEAFFARMPEWVLLGNGWFDADGRLKVNPWEAPVYLDPRFTARYRPAILTVPGVEPFHLWVRDDAPTTPEMRFE